MPHISCGSDFEMDVLYGASTTAGSTGIYIDLRKDGKSSTAESQQWAKQLHRMLSKDEEEHQGIGSVLATYDAQLSFGRISITHNPSLQYSVQIHMFPEAAGFPELFKEPINQYLESVGTRLHEQMTGRRTDEIDLAVLSRAGKTAEAFLENQEFPVSAITLAGFFYNQNTRAADHETALQENTSRFLTDQGVGRSVQDPDRANRLADAARDFIASEAERERDRPR